MCIYGDSDARALKYPENCCDLTRGQDCTVFEVLNVTKV